jgi:GNAT superfamily N-acetyltransferase
MLQRAPFEETFLGLTCYHLLLPIEPPDLAALTPAQVNGPIFASAKIDASDEETTHRLEQFGFRKVCTQILLRSRLDGALCGASKARITERLDLDARDVHAHAAQLVYGRFRQDPLIVEDAAIDLYTSWVRNSTCGAKRVAAITRNFVSFEDRAGVRWIDLLSVLDKGEGIGGKLLGRILADARRRGLEAAKAVTDRDNVVALNTFQAAGFLPERSLAVLHLLRQAERIPSLTRTGFP